MQQSRRETERGRGSRRAMSAVVGPGRRPSAGRGSRPPVPPLLLCLLALAPLRPAAACSLTAWSLGFPTPESADLLDTSILTGTCSCCAICHRRSDCASLAFSDTSGECRLYGTVANYTTLTPEAGWTYLVMPGRSSAGQFCRTDDDCTDGTPCRGRLCTAREHITCRTIRDELGAGDRYGALSPTTKMYGWLDGQPLALVCLFSAERPGFTRLFRNNRGFRYDRATIRRYGTALSADVTQPHSILYLAERLRALGSGGSPYRLLVESPGNVQIEFEVPRDTPVLAAEIRGMYGVTYSHTGRSEGGRISLPYCESVEETTFN